MPYQEMINFNGIQEFQTLFSGIIAFINRVKRTDRHTVRIFVQLHVHNATWRHHYLFFQIIKSLETLNHHQIVHNDIKPQNYLVKFLNGDNPLTSIEIGLTDFGLAG